MFVAVFLLHFHHIFWSRCFRLLQQPQSVFEGAHFWRFLRVSFSRVLVQCKPSSPATGAYSFSKSEMGVCSVMCAQTLDLLCQVPLEETRYCTVDSLPKGIAAELTPGMGIESLPQSKHLITSRTLCLLATAHVALARYSKSRIANPGPPFTASLLSKGSTVHVLYLSLSNGA